MGQTAPNIYPRKPSDIARECAEFAKPEVLRFDGKNHLAWHYELPGDVVCSDDGDEYELLIERDDFKSALQAGLDDKEEKEGIRRDVIEGSVMPIFKDDLPSVGITTNIGGAE